MTTTTADTRHHPIRIRPVARTDADGLRQFVRGLSMDSRRMRFHVALGDCSAAMAAHLAAADGVHHQAWVACVDEAEGERIVGEARFYVRADDPRRAELAIAVADEVRGRGVAKALMQTLARAAQASGVRHLFGEVLPNNGRMLAFMDRLGYVAELDAAEGVVRLSCDPSRSPGHRRTGWLALRAAWRAWVPSTLAV